MCSGDDALKCLRALVIQTCHHPALITEMAGFVGKDATADFVQERRVSSACERAVVGNCDDFGGAENSERKFEACEMAESAEGAIDPVSFDTGDLLLLHETR